MLLNKILINARQVNIIDLPIMMSKKYANKYRIESTRLQNWDYGWNAAYYVTICTLGRKYFFGNIHHGDMYLSEAGQFAKKFWHAIPNHFSFVRLGAFIVMPNHIHGIVVIDKPWGFDDDVDGNGGAGVGNGGAGVGNGGDAVGNGGDAVGNGGDAVGNGNGAVETRQCLVSTTPSTPAGTAPTPPNATPPNTTIPNVADAPAPSPSTHQSNPKNQRITSDIHKTIGQKRFQNQGKNTLSSIIGSYKSVVTKNARKTNPGFGWQSRFHDHIIRNKKAHSNISRYIENNPVNWKYRFGHEHLDILDCPTDFCQKQRL